MGTVPCLGEWPAVWTWPWRNHYRWLHPFLSKRSCLYGCAICFVHSFWKDVACLSGICCTTTNKCIELESSPTTGLEHLWNMCNPKALRPYAWNHSKLDLMQNQQLSTDQTRQIGSPWLHKWCLMDSKAWCDAIGSRTRKRALHVVSSSCACCTASSVLRWCSTCKAFRIYKVPSEFNLPDVGKMMKTMECVRGSSLVVTLGP